MTTTGAADDLYFPRPALLIQPSFKMNRLFFIAAFIAIISMVNLFKYLKKISWNDNFQKVSGADVMQMRYRDLPMIRCSKCSYTLDCPYLSNQRCSCLRSDGFPMYTALPPVRKIRYRPRSCEPCSCPIADIMPCSDPIPCTAEQERDYV